MAYSDETRDKKRNEQHQDSKSEHQGAAAAVEAGALATGLESFWDLYSRPSEGATWTLRGNGYTWTSAHSAALAHEGFSVAIVPTGENL
jgi:hypothetical protein